MRFDCPHCAFGEGLCQFVQCGRCRQICCPATVSKDRRGRLHFRCYPKCGGGGVLDRTIREVDSRSCGPMGTLARAIRSLR